MKLKVAFDNLAKFFTEEDKSFATCPAEVFKNDSGVISEIRIYNEEYEQIITIDRNGMVEALSVEEYESALKL